MNRYLFVYAFIHESAVKTLTSPQASDTLLQPIGLAGLILAGILIDYRHVLIPVAPVHLIHSDITRHRWD